MISYQTGREWRQFEDPLDFQVKAGTKTYKMEETNVGIQEENFILLHKGAVLWTLV